jgi:hypothetical protein
LHSRLQRELKTIGTMLEMYCGDHHRQPPGKLCPDCEDLQHYAEQRLRHCPFQINKPTCGKCTIHCYRPGLRQQIRAVMRYAGPKMVFRHPLLALRHLLGGRRTAPANALKKLRLPSSKVNNFKDNP